MPILKVVRSIAHGAFAADNFPGFGTVLRQTQDPEGLPITKELVDAIRLDPGFVKVPGHLGARIAGLYVTMLNEGAGGNKSYSVDTSKEVSVVLLRDVETMQKWRVLVPTQVVGGASVNADYEQPLCDIETGVEEKQFPPEGWAHAGSSHSHNTMGAFFSGTDDRNELPVPGIHFVCGKFRHEDEKNLESAMIFDVAPSIVYLGKRYEHVVDDETGKPRKMSWKDIVDFDGPGLNEHENAYDYVKLVAPNSWDNKGFDSMRGKDGKFQLAADSEYGFGYGGYLTDWEEAMIRRYHGGKITSGEMPSFRMWEPDEITDLAKYPEWIEAFDKRHTASSGACETRTIRRGVPVLVFPLSLNEMVEVDVTGEVKVLWCLRQSWYGSPNQDISCARVSKDKDGKHHYYVSIGGTVMSGKLRFFEVQPMFKGECGKWAKKQRRGKKVEERGPVERVLALGDGKRNTPFTFTTRGVSSSDFTGPEIIQMIEAWCSNIDQRTDVRIGAREILSDHYRSRR